MSKRKQPEKPQSRFSASKNTQPHNPETPSAEPRHRLRDEKSHISPLDALRKAQELSEKVSNLPPLETGSKAVEAVSEPPVKPATQVRDNPPPLPVQSPMVGGGASFNIGQALSEGKSDESVSAVPETEKQTVAPAPVPVVEPKTTFPDITKASKPATSEIPALKPSVAEDSDYIEFVPSPFNNETPKPESTEKKIDKLLDTFIKKTANETFNPTTSEDEEGIEPLLLEQSSSKDTTEEDELISFKRITPEISEEEPDFGSVRDSMMMNRRRTGRNMPKIRRVVFSDIRRRGSGRLPAKKSNAQAVTTAISVPSRKLSAERYLALYSISSSFASNIKKSDTLSPSYRRKLSPSLKKALREDRPHYSEYIQPESYDVDAPLPELIPSDFVEEGVPELFIEGGPSVEEVLKAKRAERRDSEGNVRRDLIASDFMEEAFSEQFIEYAERYNKSYDEMKRSTIVTSSQSLDSDELIDWTPVFLPPTSPRSVSSEEKLVPAGVFLGEEEYNVELSHDDYVDEEPVEDAEPVRAKTIDTVSYRDMYMESLDPDLFLSDLFADDLIENNDNGYDTAEVVSEISSAVAGVPVRAEGVEIANKSWGKYNLMLGSITSAILAVLAFGVSVLRDESYVIPMLIAGGAILATAVFCFVMSSSYKKFKIDFENSAIVQGKKVIPFSEIKAGEGVSYGKGSFFSPKVVIFKSDTEKFKALIDISYFKINTSEAEALVEFLNQTNIPYSSDTDLQDVEIKKFDGTKRNLNMLINSSFMS